MSLQELLNVIDPYQNIKIKYRGDILYTGKRMYFGNSDNLAKICVINILIIEPDDIADYDFKNGITAITICIDRPFN